MYLEMKIMVKTSIKAKEDQTDKTIKTCKGIQTMAIQQPGKVVKGIQIMDIQQPGKMVTWIDANIQIVHLFKQDQPPPKRTRTQTEI